MDPTTGAHKAGRIMITRKELEKIHELMQEDNSTVCRWNPRWARMIPSSNMVSSKLLWIR
jgi:hypothetical protein